MTFANQALIGTGGAELARALVTPALCLDLQVFEANLAAMANAAKAAGKALRPHVKAHKCVGVARAQVAAGAIGLACATIDEVAAMARAGLDHLLLTSSFANLAVAKRLASVTTGLADLLVAVDSPEGVTALALAFVGREVSVLIDINVGQNRTGVEHLTDTLAIARQIAATPGLHLRGIQAYYGQLQGMVSLADRATAVLPFWQHIRQVRAALEAQGHVIDIVTGSGTGTASLDMKGPFTELQVGSYVLMDKLYGRVENEIALGQALSVAGRVVSVARPGRAVLDAGLKAMATDAGPARACDPHYALLEHAFLGDEHSALIGAPEAVPKLDELVHLVPPHCDPTMNLHGELHILSGGVLVDIWPIASSGYRRFV